MLTKLRATKFGAVLNTKAAMGHLALGALILLFLVAPGWSDSPSVVLQNASGGTYTYGFQIPANTPATTFLFEPGDTISFMGLAGVSGQSLASTFALIPSPTNFTLGGTTPATATFNQNSGAGAGSQSFTGLTTGASVFGSWVINSSSTTEGLVNWAITGPSGVPGVPYSHPRAPADRSGTGVEGPVAGAITGDGGSTTTPETGSLLLMLVGIAGLALLSRASRGSLVQVMQPQAE